MCLTLNSYCIQAYIKLSFRDSLRDLLIPTTIKRLILLRQFSSCFTGLKQHKQEVRLIRCSPSFCKLVFRSRPLPRHPLRAALLQLLQPGRDVVWHQEEPQEGPGHPPQGGQADGKPVLGTIPAVLSDRRRPRNPSKRGQNAEGQDRLLGPVCPQV